MSAEGSSRPRSDTVLGPSKDLEDNTKDKEVEDPEPISRYKKGGHTTSGESFSLQLPRYQKLKGADNYNEWKKNMLNLAIVLDLKRHLIDDPLDPKPKEITLDNIKDATKQERLDWKEWRVGDAKAKLALSWNLTSTQAGVIQYRATAKECWDALQNTYGGSRGTLLYANDNKGKVDKDKGKGKKNKNKAKCKHCQQPGAKHAEEHCMMINTEKRTAWEKKTGKKWLPHDEYNKLKESEKEKKGKKDDSEDEKYGYGPYWIYSPFPALSRQVAH